jgi:hypothetical protein
MSEARGGHQGYEQHLRDVKQIETQFVSVVHDIGCGVSLSGYFAV